MIVDRPSVKPNARSAHGNAEASWVARLSHVCCQIAATLLVVLAMHGESHAEGPVIPPGQEQVISGLLGPLYGNALKDGHRFTGISIDRSTIRFVLSRNAVVVGNVVARPREPGDPLASQSFSFEVTGDKASRVYLNAAVAEIRARDPGNIYKVPEVDVVTTVVNTRRLPNTRHWAWLLVLVPLLLPRRRALGKERPRFRITHLLPVALQLTLFSYWALYWPELRVFAVDIVLQLLFALVFDLLLQWRRYGELRPSFGLLPIVLSANLVVIFGVGERLPHFAIIAIALLSKELLVRDGRHIFNPSGLAVSIIGLCELAFAGFPSGDIAHEFGALPNMTELVLIVAVVVQLKVRVVFITLGATVTLMLYTYVGNSFHPMWAPVTLVIALFATDPATTPRSSLGKLLFGLALGLLMGIFGDILTAMGHSDFYGKVLAVPVANVFTPWFERWGQRLETVRPLQLLSSRYNRWHVLAWAILVAALFRPEVKQGAFANSRVSPGVINQLQFNADGGLSCEQNPVHCRPFSFIDELSLWDKSSADATR